jgi:inorganic pyrophosphatase
MSSTDHDSWTSLARMLAVAVAAVAFSYGGWALKQLGAETPTDATRAATPVADGLSAPDALTLVGPRNFLTGFSAVNADNTVNIVVEIPTGTNEKWEVTRDGSRLAWELKNGKPRIVKYLGYPGNYGMVPRTKGGDGDSLDLIALGPALPRGTVTAVKLIGVLKYREDDEKTGPEDDKLIALLPSSPMYESVDTLTDLDARFPGVSRILETWFSNYKGPGKMFFQGFGDRPEAKRILAEAMGAFKE